MIRATRKTISLGVLLLATAFGSYAQVYSVHFYAGGRTYEHEWLFGSGSNCFGFEQYREYQDVNGMVVMTVPPGRGAVRCPRYTAIHLGSHSFRVQMPAWLVGALGFLGVASVVLLGRIGMAKARHPAQDLQQPG